MKKSKAASRGTILVVDDDLMHRKVLRGALKAEGFQVLEAMDGKEGLGLLKRQKIYAVISDILMPNMDGYEFCRAARADPKFKDIPFIMYSGTYVSASDRMLSQNVGADAFIQKPSSIQAILAAIAQVRSGRARPHRKISAKFSRRKNVLKEYSELLIKKLEQKNLELEQKCRELGASEARIADSEMRYRRLFESAKDGILILDAETGKIIDVNPYLVKLLGFQQREFLGKELWEIGVFKDIEINKTSFQKLKRTGYIRYEDLPLETNDGQQVDVEFVSNVYEVDRKKVIQCNVRNITERKRSAELMQKKTDALFRSNEELEQFASVASHDLKEPLRVVTNYLELLAQQLKDSADPEVVQYIKGSVNAASRMHTLINNLLEYSQLSEKGRALEWIDGYEIVNQALDNLKVTLEETRTVVSCGPLPRVWVVRQEMVQVFQNLIGNAVKYRGKEPPRVQISAKRSSGSWIFSVKDNGIGIESQYFARIFKIFQRLHSRQEYSGTGIGLAICKKIVDLNSGKIWVESEPGKGSTFHFTVLESRFN